MTDVNEADRTEASTMENSLFYLIARIDDPVLEEDQFDHIKEAFDVRCVLVEGNDALEADIVNARRIIAHIQSLDVAVLIANAPDIAQTLDADGVHLVESGMEGSRDFSALLARTNAVMENDAIKGVAVGNSRHDAMERAEKNVDYIAFDVEENDMVEMISWWGDLFEIPCVAWKVGSPEMAVRCSKAGADFIAIDLAAVIGDKSPVDVLMTFKTALADA